MERSAGILIIGNEVLSAKVEEENARFLLGELRALGVRVREVRMVPDEEETIARAVREMASMVDLLFTSGGVGPTHDDVTYAGVARAFGRPLVRHPVYEGLIRDFYGGAVNEDLLRMADLPQGATLITEGLRFPLPVVGNVWILPGDPAILRYKFGKVGARFRGAPFVVRRIWTRQAEGEIAALLREVERLHPGVQVGSYPVYAPPDEHVQVTVESRDPASTEAAFRAIEAGLDPGRIWKRG